MSKKYLNVKEDEWVYPNLRNYKFACCDCGLVHSLDFDIVVIGDMDHKTGELDMVAVVPVIAAEPNIALGIRMRARRDNRRTAQLRRYRFGKKPMNKNEDVK